MHVRHTIRRQTAAGEEDILSHSADLRFWEIGAHVIVPRPEPSVATFPPGFTRGSVHPRREPSSSTSEWVSMSGSEEVFKQPGDVKVWPDGHFGR